MEKFFCGKLVDAARKIYETIDFDKRTCPQFDIALSCQEDKETSEITVADVTDWIGIKMITEFFIKAYVVLYIGFYGVGGSRCVEFKGVYKDDEIKDLCNAIKESADVCGYSICEDDIVYVEIQK